MLVGRCGLEDDIDLWQDFFLLLNFYFFVNCKCKLKKGYLSNKYFKCVEEYILKSYSGIVQNSNFVFYQVLNGQDMRMKSMYLYKSIYMLR